MRLIPHVYPISQFIYHGNKLLSAEISELRQGISHRVYRDSCDTGFAIENPKTGNVITFALHGIEKCGDEICAWHFRPIKEDRLKANGASVVVFND